ncbi:MAG: class I SAM-dependent methyltransferase [Planctomycetota bacterium]
MKVPTVTETAVAYDRIYKTAPLGDAPRLYDWVVRLAAPSPETPVLDIGCGLGGALRGLQRAHVPALGIDISAEALRGARTHGAPNVVRGDGARLPFADETFRCVFNLGNLEHFPDLDSGISEMRRVLQVGGEAWVLLPNSFYSGTIWKAITKGYGPDHHQPIDRFATRNEWRDLLQAGGFDVLRSWPYHKGKWWKRIWPANLAWHFLYRLRRGEQGSQHALPPLGRVNRDE